MRVSWLGKTSLSRCVVRPSDVVSCPSVSPLQLSGRTVIRVQLLPKAAGEGCRGEGLGEGRVQGRGVCPGVSRLCRGSARGSLNHCHPPGRGCSAPSVLMTPRAGGCPAASTSCRIKEKRNSVASMKKYEVQSHLLVSKLIETTEAVNLLATEYTSFAAL